MAKYRFLFDIRFKEREQRFFVRHDFIKVLWKIRHIGDDMTWLQCVDEFDRIMKIALDIDRAYDRANACSAHAIK